MIKIVVGLLVWAHGVSAQGRIGEYYAYKLTYLSIPAVSISLSIPDDSTIHGRRALHLIAVARTSGLFSPFYTLENRYETWMDAETGVPIYYRKTVDQKTIRQEMTADFDPTRRVVTYRGGKFVRDSSRAIKQETHNLFSMIYALRHMPLSQGQHVRLDLDVETEPWTADIEVVGEEKIHVAGKSWECVKVSFRFSPLGTESKRKHTDILTRRLATSKTRLYFWIAKENPRPFLKVEYDASPFSTYATLVTVGSP